MSRKSSQMIILRMIQTGERRARSHWSTIKMLLYVITSLASVQNLKEICHCISTRDRGKYSSNLPSGQVGGGFSGDSAIFPNTKEADFLLALIF